MLTNRAILRYSKIVEELLLYPYVLSNAEFKIRNFIRQFYFDEDNNEALGLAVIGQLSDTIGLWIFFFCSSVVYPYVKLIIISYLIHFNIRWKRGGKYNPKTFYCYMTHVVKTVPKHLSSPPVFSGVRVTRSLVLYVCFVDRCLSFVLFLLTIVLFVLLRYTDSDYPFGIFKLFSKCIV